MVRNFKIVIFIIFVSLIIFFIFSNIRSAEEAERSIPSEEEKNEFSNIQTKSDANTYEVKDIPNKELATIYYNHFKNLVVNNSEEAYSRVRNKTGVSVEDFNNFRNNLISNYYSSKVANYRISDSTYTITNSDGDTITFYVDAVFKYEVELVL